MGSVKLSEAMYKVQERKNVRIEKILKIISCTVRPIYIWKWLLVGITSCESLRRIHYSSCSERKMCTCLHFSKICTVLVKAETPTVALRSGRFLEGSTLRTVHTAPLYYNQLPTERNYSTSLVLQIKTFKNDVSAREEDQNDRWRSYDRRAADHCRIRRAR